MFAVLISGETQEVVDEISTWKTDAFALPAHFEVCRA
jgi:hypothetical protein